MQANEPARFYIWRIIEGGRENRDGFPVPSQLRLAKPHHQVDLRHCGIQLSGALESGQRVGSAALKKQGHPQVGLHFRNRGNKLRQMLQRLHRLVPFLGRERLAGLVGVAHQIGIALLGSSARSTQQEKNQSSNHGSEIH